MGYVSFREGSSFGSSCLTIAESLRFLQMAYGVPELDRSSPPKQWVLGWREGNWNGFNDIYSIWRLQPVAAKLEIHLLQFQPNCLLAAPKRVVKERSLLTMVTAQVPVGVSLSTRYLPGWRTRLTSQRKVDAKTGIHAIKRSSRESNLIQTPGSFSHSFSLRYVMHRYSTSGKQHRSVSWLQCLVVTPSSWHACCNFSPKASSPMQPM